jgi:protein-L-isoaspartate(D-aspartate) O-methyltransferase
MEDDFFAKARQQMVDNQLVSRDIKDPRVLEAMRQVPRHLFVPFEHQNYAYTDGPLPIGLGQTISQPYIVALMTQLLELTGEEVVMEVGTGSGYQAAVLAHLAKHVHTIERHSELARNARRILKELGVKNVDIHIGDGSLGLPEEAPFEGILVTAAAPRLPKALLEQLTQSGNLVIPVGGRYGQYLERWKRTGSKNIRESITPVAFVPLIGENGWQE